MGSGKGQFLSPPAVVERGGARTVVLSDKVPVR